MKKVILAISCALTLLVVPLAAAQSSGSGDGAGQGSGQGSGRGAAQVTTPKTLPTPDAKAVADKVAEVEAIKTKIEAQNNPRWVRTLTNVQIEVTLTDQTGTGAPDKKIVSMIASSGNWGKIRSAGSVYPIGEPPYGVQLNVDARPFVSVDGPIQLEITLEYVPIRGEGDPKVGPRQRPSGINQSQTVIMQSGKSLLVSQAADPLSDRKVTVEMKATVLK